MAGSARIAPGETSWAFTPEAPWPSGGCRIVVDAILEDTAGNSVARVFDHDLSAPAPEVPSAVSVAFRPSAIPPDAPRIDRRSACR